MLASSAFVSSVFTLAQDICTAMNNWTQNKQLNSFTTEHKISATRWVCAHGTGESTVLALLGALFWNGRWNIGLWWCSTLYSDEVIDYSQEIWQTVHGQFFIYRVIHKSVKHFKNSQQINYSTDYGSSYADREGHPPPFFFFIFHRCSICPPLVIRQTSMRWSISFHTRVSLSRSTRVTAAVIRLRKYGD